MNENGSLSVLSLMSRPLWSARIGVWKTHSVLNRRIKFDLFASDRYVLLVCGGHDCDEFFNASFSYVRRSEQDVAIGVRKDDGAKI